MRTMRFFYFGQVHLLLLGHFLVSVLDFPLASAALVAQNRGSSQSKASQSEGSSESESSESESSEAESSEAESSEAESSEAESNESESSEEEETPNSDPASKSDPKNKAKESRAEKTAKKKVIAREFVGNQSQIAFTEWWKEVVHDWTTPNPGCLLRLFLAIFGVISGILLANYAFYPPSIARIEYLASLRKDPPAVVYLSARTEEPNLSWWPWPFQEPFLLEYLLFILLVLFLLTILVTARFRRKRKQRSSHR